MYERKILSLQEEIDKKKKELEELKAQKRVFESMTEPQQLATLIHESQCRLNHTDMCGWEYENDWNGTTKKGYLHTANMILNEVSFGNAVKVLRLLK